VNLHCEKTTTDTTIFSILLWKESIYINGCPDLIRIVNLKDFPMDFYGTNEIVL